MFKVSYTKLGSYRRCLQRYKWSYIDGHFPPSGIGMKKGTAGHAALGVWHQTYNRKKSLKAAWDSWVNEGAEEATDEWEMLEAALERYFVWSKANDKFKLLAAEQRFDIDYEIELPDLAHPGKTVKVPFRLNGYIDGIVQEGKSKWLLENKFYKRVEGETALDKQVSTYMLAATVLKFNVTGVIYNIIRMGDTKVAETEPVIRRRMYRNPRGLVRVEEDLVNQVKEMLLFEQLKLSPYRNETKDCHWDCPFYQACVSLLDDGREPTNILNLYPRRDENGSE